MINWGNGPPEGAPPNLEDVPQAPPVPQGGVDVNRGPSLLDRLGGTAQLVLQALQLPRRGVQTVLGGLGGEQGFRQNWIGQLAGNAMPNLLGSALLGPAGPLAAQQVMQRLPEEAQQAIREESQNVLTDPMNLVGGGWFGKAAEGLPAASRAAQVLRALDTGETFTQKALNAILLSPFHAGRGVLEHIPAPAGSTVLEAQNVPRAAGVEAQAPVERAAKSIYDLLSAKSGESFYKQDVRALGDIVGNLIHQDVNLPRAISDENLAQSGKLFFEMKPGQALSGKGVIQGLEKDMASRLGDAPNAVGQAAWLELNRALEVANAEAWHSAYMTSQMTPKTSGSVGQKLANTMYKDAVEAVTTNYRAAFDVLDDAYRAAQRLTLDPATEQQLGSLVQDAVPHLQGILDTPSTGLYAVTAQGRRSPLDRIADRLTELTQRVQGTNTLADAFQEAAQPLLDPVANGLIHPGSIAGRMGERLSQLDFLKQGLPGELANVPDFSKGLTVDTRQRLIRLAATAEKGRQGFEDGVKEIWNQYLPGQKFPEFADMAHATPDDITGHFNDVLGRITNSPTFQAQHPGAVLPTIEHGKDLLDVIRSYATPDTFNKVDRLIHQFPGADLLTGDPFMAAWDTAARGLAQRYGVHDEGKIRGALMDTFKTGNAFFKEQALASFTYPLVNASGALANSTLAGADPVRLGTNLIRAMGQVARGQPETPSYITNFEERMGQKLGGPASGTSGIALDLEAQAIREYTKTGIPVWQKIGQGPLGIGGALLGGASGLARAPEDATGDEKFRDALIGAGLGGLWFGGPLKGMIRPADRAGLTGKALDTAMGLAGGFAGGHPGMAELVRRMSIAIEDVARKDLGVMGAVTKNQELIPAYQQIIQDATQRAANRVPYVPTHFDPTAVLNKGLPVPGQIGPPTIGMNVADQGALLPGTMGKLQTDAGQRIAGALDQLHWQAPPEVVRSLLTGEGVRPEVAQKATEAWRTLNGEAMRAGENLAGQVQFDYTNLNNFEQFMKEVAPFSTWAMKAIPFFADHLTQKPLLLISLLQMEQATEQHRAAAGLPSRFAGAPHMGLADQFWSTLLGHPVMGFYNPIRGIMPFSDALRNIQEKPDANPLETFTNALQAVGLPQPSPFFMTGARIAGILGDQPAQGMIRAGPMLQGLTAAAGVNRGQGIDLNAAPEAAERNLRRAGAASVIGPQDVMDPTELGTMQRIDELYMRTFGHPINQYPGQEALPFYLAKVERSGPIWDTAAAEVAKDRGLRSAVGYIYNMASPQAVLTPEEEAIRYAKAQNILSPKLARDVNDAAKTQPTAQADPSILAAVSQASLALVARTSPGTTEQPPFVAKLLEDPTNANVQRVVHIIEEVQSHANPVSSGYTVSGSADEARLRAALALYGNQGLGVAGGYGQQLADLAAAMRGENATGIPQPGMPAYGSLGLPQLSSKGMNPISQILAQVQATRDNQKAQNPLLAKYLAWKQAHPQGDVEQFLQFNRAGQIVEPLTPP